MKFSTILIDLDRTLFDFDKTEEIALGQTFANFGLPFDSNVLQIYRNNNEKYWKLYEQGKIPTEQIDLCRFVDTFEEMGVTADVAAVAEYYQRRLDFGFELCANARELLDALWGKFALYIVTNGAIATQKSRLAGAKVGHYFEKLFISDEIGYSKPQKEFFDYALTNIDEKDLSKILIVGDSLHTDILGGKNAGIVTCLYNPHGRPADSNCDYQIDDLIKLLDIVY